jgi:gas vesicle protein
MSNRIFLFLAGAFVGSAAATLVAPCSGQKMRRMARRKIEDGAERISEVGNSLRQTRKELIHHGEKIVGGAKRVFA